jgi:hypothetical protein
VPITANFFWPELWLYKDTTWVFKSCLWKNIFNENSYELEFWRDIYATRTIKRMVFW